MKGPALSRFVTMKADDELRSRKEEVGGKLILLLCGNWRLFGARH